MTPKRPTKVSSLYEITGARCEHYGPFLRPAATVSSQRPPVSGQSLLWASGQSAGCLTPVSMAIRHLPLKRRGNLLCVLGADCLRLSGCGKGSSIKGESAISSWSVSFPPRLLSGNILEARTRESRRRREKCVRGKREGQQLSKTILMRNKEDNEISLPVLFE